MPRKCTGERATELQLRSNMHLDVARLLELTPQAQDELSCIAASTPFVSQRNSVSDVAIVSGSFADVDDVQEIARLEIQCQWAFSWSVLHGEIDPWHSLLSPLFVTHVKVVSVVAPANVE